MDAHTTYDLLRAQWRFEHDAYWGGERFRYPSQTVLSLARTRIPVLDQTGQVLRTDTKDHWTYLVPHPTEDDDSFVARLKLAHYINPIQPIVDAYAEATTARGERSTPGMETYLKDVDRQGCTWSEDVEDVARWAAVYGMVAAVADTPRHEGILSRAHEDALGIRPYVAMVHPPAWAWIDVDSNGKVCEFAFVEEGFRDQTGSQEQTIKLRILKPGAWEVREGSVNRNKPLAEQKDAISKLCASGKLPDVLGGELPVVFAYYKRDSSSKFPLGQSLVADACDLARAIYNELSWISEIHRFAGFPFLSIPLERTGGQLDGLTRVQIGPQRALPYSSAAGAPGYVQPSSESPRELREHCVWLFQIALRSAGLEMAADQSSQVQSGEALRIRSRDFEARASRYARNLERYEVQMLRLFRKLAGQQGTDVIKYPQRFTLPDAVQDLDSAIKVLTEIPVEIGVEAKLLAVKTALRAGLSLSDAEVDRVCLEIRRYFESDRDKHLSSGSPAKQPAVVLGAQESTADVVP